MIYIASTFALIFEAPRRSPLDRQHSDQWIPILWFQRGLRLVTDVRTVTARKGEETKKPSLIFITTLLGVKEMMMSEALLMGFVV